MELIPFFRLHESRYIIYWPQATTSELKTIQRKIEQEEKDRIILDAKTVDKVVCGEQQPESDHFINSDDSWTGFVEDIHWREARGWFSYQLKKQNAKYLFIKYFDKDMSRNFTISVNNKEIASVNTEGKNDDNLQIMTIEIPESLQNADTMVIKFSAKDTSMTAKIVEIRTMNDK